MNLFIKKIFGSSLLLSPKVVYSVCHQSLRNKSLVHPRLITRTMSSDSVNELTRKAQSMEVEIELLQDQVEKLKKRISEDAQLDEDECSPELLKARTQNQKLKFRKVHLERAIAEEKVKNSKKMMNIRAALESLFEASICSSFPTISNPPVILATAQNPKFGDYQCNSAMALSKLIGASGGEKMPPQKVAQQIIENIPSNEVISKMDIAGPGFINIHLKKENVYEIINTILRDKVNPPGVGEWKRVVIDFSSPNIAKQMHVGHLRSTIIGESLSRLLEFVGHDVLRLNHVGDWGTQFGMLIAHLEDEYPNFKEVSPPIADLQTFYKASKTRFDEDEAFKKRAYERVVQLQQGEVDVRKAWQLICDVSRKEYKKIYDKLGVTLIERGESFYNDIMPPTVEELKKLGICEKSTQDERWVAFSPDMKVPLILLKSDGGFTYDTSDMAALKQRLHDEKGDWLIYVVDAGQGDHFKTIFGVGQRAGWYKPEIVRVDHVAFGVVLGEDKKKFKTRSGDTVRLSELLDEGMKRAMDKLLEKERDKELTKEELTAAQKSIAFGCIKYADLCHNRVMDYVFSFDKMLDDKGNTAVYLLYAYTRVRSIQRTAKVDAQSLTDYLKSNDIKLEHEKEWKLGKAVCKFPEIIVKCMDELVLHPLCEYLYELSTCLTEFYDACYCVTKDKKTGEIASVDMNRIALLEGVARIFESGFKILGLEPVSRM